MHNPLNYIDRLIRKAFSLLIRLYQLTLSPLLGNNCRFHPTCSQYAIEALDKKSFFKALSLIIVRVAKCHPLHSGGYDPVK